MAASSPRKVLIVEDDEAIRALVHDLLEDAGYDVHEARSGRDGIERVRAVRPDLILLDKLMPDGDGTAFAREYHAARGPHAPIVALSAAADASDWATQIGAAAYLGKPLDIDELVRVVRAAIAMGAPG